MRRRRRLRSKILIVMFVLLLVVVLALAWTMSHLFETVFTSQRLDELQREAKRIAAAANDLSPNPPSTVWLSQQVKQGQTLFLVDPAGRAKGANEDGTLSTRPVQWPDLKSVLQGEPQLIKTPLPPLYDTAFVAAVPIGSSEQGAVYLIEPAASGDLLIGKLNQVLLLSVLGALLLAGGGAVILADRMAQPLSRMEKMAMHIMRGDYGQRIDVSGDDELANLGRSLNRLAAHLHHLQSTRAEFISDVSHELRTPLSYLQGYAQLLAEGVVQDEEERREHARIIYEEARRLQDLLEDLLDVSRQEEAQLKIKPVPLDLAPLLRQVTRRLQPEAARKELTLHYDGAPSLPAVPADGKRIEQVLINLLHNAIRYADRPGDVTVKARVSASQVLIAVEDRGPGIPADELPSIFNRFHRVEKSRNRELGGSGLGLSIVRQIVEEHGGHIHIRSEEGRGTTVSFVLPREGGEVS